MSPADQLTDLDWDNELRMELDTHANMPVMEDMYLSLLKWDKQSRLIHFPQATGP